MERIIGIYEIRNKTNGKVYIGQSINIYSRWFGYKSGACHNDHLKFAFNKYGVDGFTFTILEKLSPDENHIIQKLNELEAKIISEADACNPDKGYNKKEGGRRGLHTEETRKKLSESQRGKTRPMSADGKRRHTESLKRRTGTRHTEQAKRNMVKSWRNRDVGISHSTQLLGAEKRSLAVICLETGIEYSSMNKACKELGLSTTHLRLHLRGEFDHIKGLHFKEQTFSSWATG